MRRRKILGTQLLMAMGAIIIGLKMKIEHVDYANLVIVLGFAGLMVLYPFRYLAKREKKDVDRVRLTLILLCGINGMALGWEGLRKSFIGDYGPVVLKVFVGVWVIVELLHRYRRK